MPCLIWLVIVLSTIVCYHMISGWICVDAIYTEELESYMVIELMRKCCFGVRGTATFKFSHDIVSH